MFKKLIFSIILIQLPLIFCEDESPITFYDLNSKQPLLPPITTVIPNSGNMSLDSINVVNFIRLPFIGQPCKCESLTCGCCAGMAIQQFNFDQKMCMSFTYDPYEFSIGMDMTMNDNSIFQNAISGKNPPPLCLPVPTGPFPLGFEMCVKMFNIFTPGYNLHMCMDIMAQIQSTPIMIMHFDCMRFGRDGPALFKPEDNGGLDQLEGGESEGGAEGIDVENDPLFPEEERKKKKNSTKT